MGSQASHTPGEYAEPQLGDGQAEVRVSVYKIDITGLKTLDSLLGDTVGAYHSAIVVHGLEYAYGGHDAEGESGVYTSKPERDQNYRFYQRVVMGRVNMTKQEVRAAVKEMADQWMGPSYDLVAHNCNHFASDLCWKLLQRRPPRWINDTARNMVRRRRRARAESAALEEAQQRYATAHGPLKKGEAALPGERAFTDAFAKTFDLSWKQSLQELKVQLERCDVGRDTDELDRQWEADAIQFAVRAANAVAEVVGRAARSAAEARVQQNKLGLDAWDTAWQSSSGPLLRLWREAAVAGELEADDEAQNAYRAQQVQEALSAAAEACRQRAAIATADWKEAVNVADAVYSLECTHDLGANPDFRDVECVPEDRYSSVSDLVDALNAGQIAFKDGICAVFSKNAKTYYLVYRRDKQRQALSMALKLP
eukprot:TRINITY_DN38588_c0_g1_i1.p1 TRINITY_DN38588_c0_g1~~TRINITY_DN38588_c0_g1_i1.p1  ORF type:complete len:424 (+),score=110.21 TRINITY_DN38588_c0_g1_i1:62-1333(+)